jgi:hypothetical protein
MNKSELITIYNKMIENGIAIKSLTINYNGVYDIGNIDVVQYLNGLQDISSYNMTFNIEHNTQRDSEYRFVHDDWRVIDIIFHGSDNRHGLAVNYLSNYNLISSSSSQLLQLFDNPYSGDIKNKFNIEDIHNVITYVNNYIQLMDDAVAKFKSIKNKFSVYFY